MRQYEAVIQAMKENGGYATLGHLYQAALKIPDVRWGTKTPFASIRRIVQQHPEFFRIRPGLWALTSERERILEKFKVRDDAPRKEVEEFNHSYYQGLIVEIGNFKRYDTYVPNQDKNKQFLSQRLADISSLKQFPPFTYEHLLKRARTVDVTWFNARGFPDAFFEIEHSTDIHNSLLKFVEFQDFRIQFYIVADAVREREFEQKKGYSAFNPIRADLKFLDYESLSTWHSKLSESIAIEKAMGL